MEKITVLLLVVLSTVSYSQNQKDREIEETAIPTLIVDSSTTPDSIYELNPFLSWSPEADLPGQWYSMESAPQAILPQDSLWLRVRLNTIQKGHYILYLHDLPNVRAYAVKENNPMPKALHAGTLILPEQKQVPTGLILERFGNSAQVKLSLDKGRYDIYLKLSFMIRESFQPQIRLFPEEIWEEEVFKQRESMLPFQGIILGALLVLTLYHLLIYFQRRDISFLLYSLYTFTMSMVVGSEIGIMQIYLFPDHAASYRISNHVSLFAGLVTVVYFLFMRSFVHLDKLLPRLDTFLIWYLRILIPSGTLFIFLYFWTLHPIFTRMVYLYTFSGLLLGIVYIVGIFRTRDTLAIYFTVGSLFLVLGVVFNTIISTLLDNDFINSFPFARSYLVEGGAVIEAIVFALGLGYRQRLKEKEQQRIEELDQMKSKFFANISHEFRTPLTVIMGIANQIKGHQKEIKLITRNSQNLLQLVNQLLDLSKLDSGNMGVQKIQGDIVSYLKFLTESFYSMAQEKKIQLTFYPEVASLSMDYDEEKIQQIIYNLLSNALKFTPENGKVVLHVKETTFEKYPHIQIKVRDTGVGMSAEALKSIYNRFYQTESSHSSNIKGTGLGLALTKELIGMLGGQIEVSSELEKGTEFNIYLPIFRQAPIATDAPNAPAPLNIEAEGSTAATLKPKFGDYPLLLLIEDNRDVVTYIQTLLQKMYDIQVAYDGAAGIEKAKEIVPDIIISDVMMPKKNGYEVCQSLKSDARTSHIPIILLTAKATTTDRVQGLRQGADAYLTKPFNKEELQVRLQKLVALRRQLQEKYGQMPILQKKKTATTNLEDAFLQKLLTVIEKRINDTNLGVKDLCHAARLSSVQVNRKLKALTGKTPSLFIRLIRLQKGKEMLQTTDLTVSEVAYSVGFTDPNYFSRAFSEEFGHAPSETRN